MNTITVPVSTTDSRLQTQTLRKPTKKASIDKQKTVALHQYIIIELDGLIEKDPIIAHKINVLATNDLSEEQIAQDLYHEFSHDFNVLMVFPIQYFNKIKLSNKNITIPLSNIINTEAKKGEEKK